MHDYPHHLQISHLETSPSQVQRIFKIAHNFIMCSFSMNSEADDEPYRPAAAAASAAPQRCFPERNHNLTPYSRTISESFWMKKRFRKVPLNDESERERD